MGRGDKKSAKGKRTIGSYGVSRKKKKSTYPAATATNTETVKVEAKAEKKPAAKKPAAAKKVKEETSSEE
jgi:30S ribosomal protein S31